MVKSVERKEKLLYLYPWNGRPADHKTLAQAFQAAADLFLSVFQEIEQWDLLMVLAVTNRVYVLDACCLLFSSNLSL